MRRSKASKMNKDHLELIIKLFRYAVFSIVIIWIMAILGVQLSGLLVAGGIAGIVLGFASQSIVGNMISGIFLMLERPFKIGDAVNIENTIGIIESISIISTTIRTFEGLHIRVPNQKIFTSNITNFVSNVARRFEYSIGIRYSDDAMKAIAIINKILEDEIFVLKNPAPIVYVDKLGDNSVEISVRIWGPISEWFALKQKLLWKIKATLEENGIEIAFPQRVVWLQQNIQ
jgi:small-conductance mechanosensitive channel